MNCLEGTLTLVTHCGFVDDKHMKSMALMNTEQVLPSLRLYLVPLYKKIFFPFSSWSSINFAFKSSFDVYDFASSSNKS